ncbi:radical SAM protein [Paraclostridium bifermentans]|uniref:radical SAM protein n=1 Tax=Paraclostridium bifermentans TaxID=1490 RepID=UPI00241C36D4|nr:radical SAM protein [Paraclostridium bifermentans]
MIRNISVTIKPTMACNMRCKHCFNGEKLCDKKVLEASSTCNFLRLLAEEYKNVRLTFHGGEPTLVGIDFYHEIFKYQNMLTKKYGTTFSNSITTNGLALTDDLIDLFMENDVLFNISFDGPHNDILRENTDLVYNKICKLQEKGAKLRVYCIETSKSFKNLDETYEWFKKHNISFKLIPVQPQGNAKENNDLIMNPVKFVSELMHLYRKWLCDQQCNIKFYTFEEFLELDPNLRFKPHWFYRKLALNPDGKIYPFGRPNDINFCLGDPNLLSSINECFEVAKYKELISILDEYRSEFCTNCKSSYICNGITICSSFVYGDDYDMLKYGCTLSDLIFRGVLSVNAEVKEDFKNKDFEKYSNKVKMKFNRISI